LICFSKFDVFFKKDVFVNFEKIHEKQILKLVRKGGGDEEEEGYL
jgi:hypothetical protein